MGYVLIYIKLNEEDADNALLSFHGLKMKKRRNKPLFCPRCGKHLIAPSLTAFGNKNEKESKKGSSTYKRKGDSWESFLCECGQTIHLSPILKAKQITCKKCKNKIRIET